MFKFKCNHIFFLWCIRGNPSIFYARMQDRTVCIQSTHRNFSHVCICGSAVIISHYCWLFYYSFSLLCSASLCENWKDSWTLCFFDFWFLTHKFWLAKKNIKSGMNHIKLNYDLNCVRFMFAACSAHVLAQCLRFVRVAPYFTWRLNYHIPKYALLCWFISYKANAIFYSTPTFYCIQHFLPFPHSQWLISEKKKNSNSDRVYASFACESIHIHMLHLRIGPISEYVLWPNVTQNMFTCGGIHFSSHVLLCKSITVHRIGTHRYWRTCRP